MPGWSRANAWPKGSKGSLVWPSDPRCNGGTAGVSRRTRSPVDSFCDSGRQRESSRTIRTSCDGALESSESTDIGETGSADIIDLFNQDHLATASGCEDSIGGARRVEADGCDIPDPLHKTNMLRGLLENGG
jgi:hypothetical protein